MQASGKKHLGVKAQHDTVEELRVVKVKNIALPVNKLNNADGPESNESPLH